MILTVTLNPAVDLFLEVPRIEWNEVLRAAAARRSAGGKGINVSRMLRLLGEPSHALTLGSGATGRELQELAHSEGLEISVIESGQPVRTNLHISNREDHRHLKVNMAGEEITAAVLEPLADRILRDAPRLTAVVLAGRLPPGLPKDTWAILVRMAREVGLPSFVDTSGQELAEALREIPAGVKVNRGELEETLGVSLDQRGEAVKALEALRRTGIATVCMTDGGRSAVLADERGFARGAPPAVSAHRPVGAGDCFMAGLVSAYLRGQRGSALLRRSIACGTAWAVRSGDSLPTSEEIRSLEEQVRITTDYAD